MIWHPYTIQKGSPTPILITRAEGEFLYDAEGKSYIDMVSSWWISIHGHNRKELVEAAQLQLSKLDQVLLAGFSNEPAKELAKKLIEFSGNYYKAVYYSDNGSCANEISIKMAIQYYKNLGIEEKNSFIKFSLSYHGDTIGAMSVGGNSIFTFPFQSILFPNIEFLAPDCAYCPVNKTRETCKEECLVSLEEYLEKNSHKIAGIIIEPLIFGANGMRIYKVEVLTKLRKLADKFDLILIYDEVFTGFGRTGKNFAFEHNQMYPDIINLAKGLSGGVLPLAATLINEKVYNAFYSEKVEHAFYHGHTMTGNPTACAVALKSIEIYEKENRLQDVNILEFYLKKYLKQLRELLGDCIFASRVLGGVGAFELLSTQANLTKQVARECIESGVLIRPLGDTIYFVPPYTISKTSLEKAFEVLAEKLLLKKKQGLLKEPTFY